MFDQRNIQKFAEIAFAVFFTFSFLSFFFPVPTDAQGFSGSNQDQYYCPSAECGGVIDSGSTTQCPGVPAGRFVCLCPDSQGNISCANAIPSPPTLRVLEFWFTRILFSIWAFSGIVFTFILIYLGFKYMTSLGDSGAIEDVKKRIRYWVIGVILVFLAYPILNTVFGAIGLSDSECFNDLQMPAFQIFFPDACQA